MPKMTKDNILFNDRVLSIISDVKVIEYGNVGPIPCTGCMYKEDIRRDGCMEEIAKALNKDNQTIYGVMGQRLCKVSNKEIS